MSPLCLKSWNGFPSIVSHRIKTKSLQQPARSPMTCPRPWPLCSQLLLFSPFIHSDPTGLSAPALPSVGNPLPQMHQFCSESFPQWDWPWLPHSTHSRLTLTFPFNYLPLPHLLILLCCFLFSFFHSFHHLLPYQIRYLHVYCLPRDFCLFCGYIDVFPLVSYIVSFFTTITLLRTTSYYINLHIDLWLFLRIRVTWSDATYL